MSLQEDRILLASHGLLDGDSIRFALGVPGNVLPAPFVEGTYYFVVGARGNDFQVSLSAGGSVIDITDRGTGANEIWKHESTKPGETLYTWAMSSTVKTELLGKDIWRTKLIV